MSFDSLAPIYNPLEFLLAQHKLQRCRERWLDEIGTPSHIALIGEGTGRGLHVMLNRFPDATVTCVDQSGGMLQCASRSLQAHPENRRRVRWIQADIRESPLEEDSYDLIATHFFLDCFNEAELPGVVEHLSHSMHSSATWILSEFHQPNSGWKRWRARCILRMAYLFFQATTHITARHIPDYGRELMRMGFQRQRQDFTEWGLLTAQLWRRSAIPA